MRATLSRNLRRFGLRPAPLDFRNSTIAEEGEETCPGIEVVVPIHGAHEEAGECLRSIARHTDFAIHRVAVVIDGDPSFTEQEARSCLGDPSEASFRCLQNEEARGFVASVNAAMESSDLDVVLLNSDTVVTANWLSRLRDAAYSHPGIATVTPFSNHATICSLPEPGVANDLPDGYDVDSFGELVASVSRHTRPRIPTGVGMCLYIKRIALDRLGAFDEAAFGRGYGEETDFCFRALGAGFIHILDDSTFVFHHGEKSFGAERKVRIERSERLLRRRHPSYVATLDAFFQEDPVAEARRIVRWALRGASRNEDPPRAFSAGRLEKVLHLVHGWPPYNHAGTELYAAWLSQAQSRYRKVAVQARIADPSRRFGEVVEEREGELRVQLVVNNFDQRNPLSRNALRSLRLERRFSELLDEFQPDLVHVHHLAGHGFGLTREIVRRRLPWVYQVQDWWAYCARANLLRRPAMDLCSGPSLAACSRCLPMTGLPLSSIWNPALYAFRRRLASACFRSADAFVMGSRAIESDYRSQGLLQARDGVYVLPYGVPTAVASAKSIESFDPALRPLRLGYIGSIQPHKGLHVVAEAMAGLSSGRACFEVWGDPSIDPDYAARIESVAGKDRLSLRGRFEEGQKEEILDSFDLLVLPSLGLESFGLVAREAMARGVPVLASRRGALVELFFRSGAPAGALFEAGNARELLFQIEQILERPAILDAWRRGLPEIVSVEEHAEAIEQVYADVLERRAGEVKSSL